MGMTNLTRNIQLEKTTAILKAHTGVLIQDGYICRVCRGRMDALLSGRIFHSELGFPWMEEVGMECPRCGGEVAEAFLCHLCGESFPEEELTDGLCPGCHKDLNEEWTCCAS